MKLPRDTLRRRPLLLLALPPLFVLFSYLCGLLLGPVLFDSFVGGILFLALLISSPWLFTFGLFKVTAVFFDALEGLSRAERQEREQPGSVPPEEFARRRLRFALAVGIPLLLGCTTFGYTVLLGNPILSM